MGGGQDVEVSDASCITFEVIGLEAGNQCDQLKVPKDTGRKTCECVKNM